MVERVGAGPEAAHAVFLVADLDRLDGARDVVERHRTRDVDTTTRRLAHLLAPAVVRDRKRLLQTGIDAVDPQVVFGAVDHHHVDAVADHAGGNGITGEAGVDHVRAVLVAHVVVGPIDVRHEVAVDRDVVLRVAPVDGHRPVGTGRRFETDAILELGIQEAVPHVHRIHDVTVRVEDLESIAHAGPLAGFAAMVPAFRRAGRVDAHGVFAECDHRTWPQLDPRVPGESLTPARCVVEKGARGRPIDHEDIPTLEIHLELRVGDTLGVGVDDHRLGVLAGDDDVGGRRGAHDDRPSRGRRGAHRRRRPGRRARAGPRRSCRARDRARRSTSRTARHRVD